MRESRLYGSVRGVLGNWHSYRDSLRSNLLAVVLVALRGVHGEKTVEAEVSLYYIANKISTTYHGMMIAIPAPAWDVFYSMSPADLAAILLDVVGESTQVTLIGCFMVDYSLYNKTPVLRYGYVTQSSSHGSRAPRDRSGGPGGLAQRQSIHDHAR
jgi:hypothetical protein